MILLLIPTSLSSKNLEFETIFSPYLFKHYLIFNDIHFSTGDNIKLIYSFDKGSFYPLYSKNNLINKII